MFINPHIPVASERLWFDLNMTRIKDCNGESNRKVYQCDICPQTRTTAEQLKTHKLEVHEKKKRHHCTRCDFKSYRKDTVDRHLKAIHLKIKDWKCEACNRGFIIRHQIQRNNNKVHKTN